MKISVKSELRKIKARRNRTRRFARRVYTAGEFREGKTGTVEGVSASGSLAINPILRAFKGSVKGMTLYDTDALSPNNMIRLVQKGLPIRRFEELRDALGLPSENLAEKVGMSKATFHRRQKEGKLTPDESDKAMRFGRLLVKAISVFESDEAARQWLSSPQHGLGGAVPLDYAGTEVGAREVENLLGRIDHGVYS